MVNAAKFEKDVVLNLLSSNCPHSFMPVCVTKNNGDYSFYVESPSAAMSLKSLDKKITITHQFMLKIKVAPSPPPKHFLNEEIKQKIKEVMAKRYNPMTKALDMKNFHNDPMFVGEAAYVPLARSNVMNNVMRIIGENVPDIEAIDFSNNKLPSLDHFSMLDDMATPNLTMLDLSNNRLNDIRELEKLSTLKLKCLNLKDNAVTIKFQDTSEYVTQVRKKLPKLEMLDGNQLPKNVTFND